MDLFHRVTIYRDPRTGVYWLNYLGLDSRRQRESTGAKLRKEAEVIRAKKAEELFKAAALGVENVKQATPIKFSSFVDEVLMPHFAGTLEPSTYKDYVIRARQACATFGDKILTAIATSDVQAYLDKVKTMLREGIKCETCERRAQHPDKERCPRAIAPATANRQRSFISRVFSEAVKRDYVKANPVSRTKKLKEDNVRVRCLTLEEEERIVAKCDPWFRPILELAAATGMRRSEIMRLRWEDVDLKALQIRVLRTKAHLNRSIRIRLPAKAVLETLSPVEGPKGVSSYIFADPSTGEPWKKGQLNHAMKRAVRKAGVRDVKGIHDLRHTLGTRLYRVTKDLQAVQKVLGHSVITTSARYAHTFQEDLDQAMDKLDAPRGGAVNMASTSEVAREAKSV